LKGTRSKSLMIRFKRTPKLSKRQQELKMNRILDKANQLYHKIHN
jgi:hypothetical protein